VSRRQSCGEVRQLAAMSPYSIAVAAAADAGRTAPGPQPDERFDGRGYPHAFSFGCARVRARIRWFPCAATTRVSSDASDGPPSRSR
jgi:hypothetical protein